MIERYRDHAANERTMLAWVRTAMTIIAFGFLVEKLNLFLRLSNPSLSADSSNLATSLAEWLGMGLIFAGVAVIVIALLRYYRISAALDAPESHHAKATVSDLSLFVMLAIMVVAIAAFFAHEIGILG